MGHPLTLIEVYAHIHYEESRRGVMSLTPFIEKVALILSSFRGSRGNFLGRGRGGRSAHLSNDRDRLKCEHCGRHRHTKDQCWDLYGCHLDLASRTTTHGGFGNGRGGGRSGGQRPSAHSVSFTPIKLSTQPPHPFPDIGALSGDERRFDVLFLSLINLP